jgi:hypothetical protein
MHGEEEINVSERRQNNLCSYSSAEDGEHNSSLISVGLNRTTGLQRERKWEEE